MIWKTKTHEFTATVCRKTGKTCPALARMARAITQAVETASLATTPDFEIEGCGELAHCAQGCTARFRAHADQVRVFCGTDADTPITMLDGYANRMFGTTCAPLPAGHLPNPPCAMLEVSVLESQPAAQIAEHLAL